MARYLEGIDEAHVHKLWLLKQEAKRNGQRSTSILTILNAVLADALTDARMNELRARFCAPKEIPNVGTQAPVPQLGHAGG